jgi:RNase P subunit RPR2
VLEKVITGILGNEVSPYALLSSLMNASANQNSKLTPEEKAERAERRRLLSEQRIREVKIIKNICPDCEGKLIRGKKDKKNDYKRIWTCKDCGNAQSV